MCDSGTSYEDQPIRNDKSVRTTSSSTSTNTCSVGVGTNYVSTSVQVRLPSFQSFNPKITEDDR